MSRQLTDKEIDSFTDEVCGYTKQSTYHHGGMVGAATCAWEGARKAIVAALAKYGEPSDAETVRLRDRANYALGWTDCARNRPLIERMEALYPPAPPETVLTDAEIFAADKLGGARAIERAVLAKLKESK